jgi:5'-phosphate synthase pdxT subunit
MQRIGILALQGAFYEHINHLNAMGVETFEIRQLEDIIRPFDGLILPGGESTVMGRLLHDLQLFEPLHQMIFAGLPVFGTCAGAILLAKTLSNDTHTWFQTMNITVKRNAYGRQLGSFKIVSSFKDHQNVPMVFIRAPKIESIGENIEILAMHNQTILACREGNQLVTTFHPEVTDDLTIHQYFVSMCQAFQDKQKGKA